MKRFLIFFLFIIILFIAAYFSVGSNVPILKSIKNIIPKEFKNKLKSTIFLSRYKTKETIYIIKSDSPNSFELEKDSKIYIYSNSRFIRRGSLWVFYTITWCFISRFTP